MATESNAPRGHIAYVILVLTILVVASVGAIIVMLARINTSNAAFRAEVEKELLIGDMGAAVQQESQIFGTWTAAADDTMDHSAMDITGGGGMAAGGSDDPATSSMSTDSMSVGGTTPAASGTEDMAMGGANMSDASEDTALSEVEDLGMLLTAPQQRFALAAGALRELQLAGEQAQLDQAITAHALLMGSGSELSRLHVNDGTVMATYHGSTQLLEADLRSTLEGLRIQSSERVAASITDVAAAEGAIRVLLPLLALAALGSSLTLSRLMSARRKAGALEDLVSAKDEFIASVSHELRTPLTGVVGFAIELEDQVSAEGDSEAAQLMAIIVDEAQQAAHLVEDLLVAARSDIGKVDISSEAADLRVLAEKVLAEGALRRSGKLDSIDLRGTPVVAYADPYRVRQIVRNLLTNAVRYGGDQVSVNLRQSSGTATLQVVDNGPGVPAEWQEKIFDAYVNSPNGSSHPESVGLGLAVARRLARLMDGDLIYRYEHDLSVFELRLPAGVS